MKYRPLSPLVSAFVLTAVFVAAAPAQASRPTGRFDTSGWRPLFDGKTLDGWTTRGGRYDGDAAWSVEDGCITGREGKDHAGGLLYTAVEHHSFLFSTEVKLDHPFDSGVFLRMAKAGRGTQVTLDDREGGEIGAIYADGFLAHNPTGLARWRRDEWNRLEIRCVGLDYRVTVWLNGVEIMDYRLPPGTPDQAPTGLIGLQVHGARQDAPHLACRFRDVRLRELPVFDLAHFDCDEQGRLAPTEAGKAAGWRALFDGGALDAFEVGGDARGVRVENGALVFAGAGGGDVRTKEDFGDFELCADFEVGRMANSGVFLRSARTGDNPSYTGWEIQVLDDFNYERVSGRKLRPYQFTGGLYGSRAPDVAALRPLGTWNTYRMRLAGSRLRVELNARVLHGDVDLREVPGAPPFAERAAKGFLGFQRHAPPDVGDAVYLRYRNIFVRAL
jgi:hypothetical protein